MPTVTSRRASPASKILAKRRAIADELLGLHIRLAAEFRRMDELETELKAIATEGQASFKESFEGEGHVSVAPAHAAEFKGDVPVIQTEIYLALPPVDRKRLEKTGLIRIEPQWGRPSYGRVTVKIA